MQTKWRYPKNRKAHDEQLVLRRAEHRLRQRDCAAGIAHCLNVIKHLIMDTFKEYMRYGLNSVTDRETIFTLTKSIWRFNAKKVLHSLNCKLHNTWRTGILSSMVCDLTCNVMIIFLKNIWIIEDKWIETNLFYKLQTNVSYARWGHVRVFFIKCIPINT